MNNLKSNNLLLVTLVLLSCSACKHDGAVSNEDLNKVLTCKNSIDNQEFSYNTNTVHNVKITGLNKLESMSFVTLKGESMTISGEDEHNYRCEIIIN